MNFHRQGRTLVSLPLAVSAILAVAAMTNERPSDAKGGTGPAPVWTYDTGG